MPTGSMTVGSVHVPSAMGGLSVRGRGKKWKFISRYQIEEFACKKGISFVQAYRHLTSEAYCSDGEKKK